MALHTLDIAGLRRAYAAAETRPSAVTAHYLARIDRIDPNLKSYVEIDRAGARAAAAESDARVAAGTARVLEGVPVAVKSNIAVKGLELNAGMEARRGIIADADAESVARLRAAGAIIVGTLNMHEAAMGATTDNPWFGRTSNAHRPGYTPGGSSGGSGAAVGAGLCVASLGTDTLGSVRIPAAYNGVYGIKPTHGAISDEGLVPLSLWLDSIGPIARSLGDLDTLLAVLTDPREPVSTIERVVLLDDFGDIECEPAVLAAYQRAVAVVSDLPQSKVALSGNAAAVRFAGFIVSARELGEHLAALRETAGDKFSKELSFMLDYAAKRAPEDVAQAETTIAETKAAVLAAIGNDGVLLMPTAPQAAFVHGARPPVTQSGFTSFANIAGLPAITVPAGLDENRMPIAIQLVGGPNSEKALLDLAAKLDDALGGYAPSPLI